MSIFKTNKFFRVIKHFILCLPLMFVLGSSLYAIVNPNAKDSYYGETINESKLVDAVNLNINTDYYFSLDSFTPTGSSSSYIFLTITERGNLNDNIWNARNDIDSLSIYNNVGANTYSLRFRNSLNNSYYYQLFYNQNDVLFNVYFNFKVASNHSIDWMNGWVYYTEYTPYSYLSNAFEYGMYQFNQIGFGQFDFIGLFNGIFTTSLNNVYATFINDYVNYYLFVEMVYFTPWVIHTFIHFAYDLGEYFTSSFKRNKKEDD